MFDTEHTIQANRGRMTAGRTHRFQQQTKYRSYMRRETLARGISCSQTFEISVPGLLELHRRIQAIYTLKETSMKTIITAVASTFLICAAYTASAASPADPSPAAMAKGDQKRDTRVEQQIKDLHAKLKISPTEESQWTAVAKTMRESAKDLDAAIDKREASHNTATAVDDLNAYGEVAQAHADAVKKLASAFAPLYASMADDQKKTADDVFANRKNVTAKK
jgi:hypothetical protein